MPCLCLLSNARRALPGQENAFVQDFIGATVAREEMVHLFINTNELVVFRNTILEVN